MFIAKGYKILYTIIYLVLFSIYPISRNIGESGNFVHQLLNLISGYLLPFYLYLWLSVMLFDLFLLFNLIFKFVSKEKRRTFQYRFKVLFSMILISAFVVIGGAINLNTIRYSNYKMSVPKRNSKIDKLRVAFVADIHLLENTRIGYINKFVNKINATQADIVLFGGDIVEGDSENETSVDTEKAFQNIRSKYGSFGVVGNHEFYGRQQHSTFFEKAGITMLYDTIVNIDNSFYLGGRYDQHFRERKGIQQILNQVQADLPIIFLDHRPTRLQEVGQTDIDAQFSGHTHNGQLFPFNFIIKQMYELSWGYKKIGNTHFFVTSGLRLWGPPVKTTGKSEIMVVDFAFD